MSSVIVNKVNSDQVEVEFIQSGSDTITTVLKDSLLDGGRGYNFSVVSLSCPLDATPMFPITQETELFAIHRRHVGASQTADIAAYTLAYNTYNDFVTTVAVEGTDVVLQALANAENVQGLGGAYNRAQWVAAITAHYVAALEAAAIPTTFSLIPPAGRTASYFISPDRPLYSAAEFLQDLNAWCHVFSVEQIERNSVLLKGRRQDEIVRLRLPPDVLSLIQLNDFLDLILGDTSEKWVVLEAGQVYPKVKNL